MTTIGCLSTRKRKVVAFATLSSLLITGLSCYLILRTNNASPPTTSSWSPLTTSTGPVPVDPQSLAVVDDNIPPEPLLTSIAAALLAQGVDDGSSSILISSDASAQSADSQFFVQFSGDAGEDTLKAFAAYTGRPVLQYVGDRAFLALGDDEWSAVARTFPGVVFVQLREPSSKICPLLTDALAAGPVTQALIAQCFSSSSCDSAASVIDTSACSVFNHDAFIEVACEPSALPSQLASLVASPNIHYVELKPLLQKHNFAGKSIVGAGPAATSPDQSLALTRIPMDNSVVAIADTGIDQTNCFFYGSSRVLHTYWFQGPDQCSQCGGCARNGIAAIGCGNGVDEDGHGTHVSGTVAGLSSRGASHASSRFNGIAAGSKIFFQDIMNEVPDAQCPRGAGGCTGGLYPPSNLQNLFAPAYTAGARVHSNSWGSSGNGYGAMPLAIDTYSYNNPDFLVVFAAGNAGTASTDATVGQPATCKSCISVGASDLRSDQLADQNQYLYPRPGNPAGRLSSNLAVFSSAGPTLDGRFKPDVVAPGVDTVSAYAPGRLADYTLIPTVADHCDVGPNAYTAANAAVQRMSGTSMATPLTAGAAERVRQYFVKGFYPSGAAVAADARSPAASTVRAVIIGGAQPLAGKLPNMYPNVYTGFGLVNLDASLYFSGASSLRLAVTEAAVTSTERDKAYTFQCSSSAATSVSLVWSDAPGSTTARKQLVNDLDLIVRLADGSQRYGNGQGFADSVNTAEKVVLASCSGTITIIVRADTLVTVSQTFSLVVQGAVVPPLIAAALPAAYDTGRPIYLDRTSSATRTTDCTAATSIIVSVPFKAGLTWTAANAVINGRVFTSGLAMLLGVGISAVSYTYTTGELAIKCDVFIGPGLAIRYRSNTITRDNLYAAVRDTSSPLYSSSAFAAHNWAQVLLPPSPTPAPTPAPSTTAAPTTRPPTTAPPASSPPAPPATTKAATTTAAPATAAPTTTRATTTAPPATSPPSCPSNCRSIVGYTVNGSRATGCRGCTYYDINECSSPTLNQCDTANYGVCVNYAGDYSCVCTARKGYTVTGQATTRRPCVYSDINECSSRLVRTHCDASAACRNSVGSYSCSCPARAGFMVTGTGAVDSPCVYTRI